MGYNILIIEKSEEEWKRDNPHIPYERVTSRAETSKKILTHYNYGHNVRIIYGLDSVTETDYSGSDVVLAHPNPASRNIEKLVELHDKFKNTGLIIITGDNGKIQKECNRLGMDETGFFFLFKPYRPKTLNEAINEAIKEVVRYSQ